MTSPLLSGGREGSTPQPMDLPILPGLPSDLALLCLGKLPIDAVARSRAVSRAWSAALGHYPPSLSRLPQGLAVFCKGKEDDNSMSWLFLSRPDHRSLVVPFFFLKAELDHNASVYTCGLQVIGTGTPLILVRTGLQFRDHHKPLTSGGSDCTRTAAEEGHQQGQAPGSFLQGFDMWHMKWLNPGATPWGPMLVDRWQFATAHIGKYVYFAGGNGPGAASTAERLRLDTWTWETLPPMHKERSFHPSAFTIGGCLVVVGGESLMVSGTAPQSGEFYDPTTNAWTLVPDMWPHDLWWAFGGPQIVAVIENVAYTINHNLQVLVQLKMDSPSFTNAKWHVVGQLPLAELNKEFIRTMPCLLSVQDELWAVLNSRDHDSVVFSCRPNLDSEEELHWERHPYIISPSTRSTLTTGVDVSI